ncbi:MAG: tellurite resistance TerB family protein [Phenylobacterium sp.]|uniref:tellurite resistance TerB family protein n=1 Tax=Phenylobacterium sp. TaxID=1871053 RepID=UPI001A37F94D|nr:TerB family tellurite resistance protein [Phenylobacterium sp.]MBL8771501.1 tellurite resistance TerB family protein [Phenylobacterium sp.]
MSSVLSLRRPIRATGRAEQPLRRTPESGRALAAACAIVAGADGWPTDDERRQMVERLRLLADSTRLDLEHVVRAFDRFLNALIEDPETAEPVCMALIARLRSDPGQARALLQACNAVAMADGGYDEAERQAVRRICRAVGVSAEEVGVADAP